MIRTHDGTDTVTISRQQALAAALDGRILGPSTIKVGTHLVSASPLGKICVDGIPVGCWSDDTASLAARARAVMDGRRVNLGPVGA